VVDQVSCHTGATAVVPWGGIGSMMRSVIALLCSVMFSAGRVGVKPCRGRGGDVAAEVGKATAKINRGVARQPK